MMLQTQFNISHQPPVYMIYPLPREDERPSGLSSRLPSVRIPEKKSLSGQPLAEKRRPGEVLSEMPLWPTLAKIRPAADMSLPREKCLRQTLICRSALIGAAMMSLAMLGVLLAL